MKPKSISNIGELHVRISKIRQDFCYKNNMDFAKKIGANVSHASGICSGSKLAGPETLEKILAAFPQVNRSWLYFGEGEMLSKSDGGNETPVNNTINSSGDHNNNTIGPADPIIKLYESRLTDKDEQIKVMKEMITILQSEVNQLRDYVRLTSSKYVSIIDQLLQVSEETKEMVEDCHNHIGFKTGAK